MDVRFTRQEKKIMSLIYDQDLSEKEIALREGIDLKDVHFHKKMIILKLKKYTQNKFQSTIKY